MADIGGIINALNPAEFVKGYTIGEELALKKENSEVLRRQHEAETARLGEYTNRLAFENKEFQNIGNVEQRATATASQTLANQLSAMDRGARLKVGQANIGEVESYYGMGLKTAAAKADQDYRTAVAAGDNLGMKLAMDKKDLIAKAGEQDTALATRRTTGETGLVTATTAGLTEADKLANVQLEQFVKSQPTLPGEDDYMKLDRIAQQVSDPVQKNAALRAQKQIAAKGLAQAGFGGDPVEFVKQYNRLNIGSPRKAQLTDRNQVVIGEAETVQDWSMVDPNVRIKKGTELVIDTTNAEGMFALARQGAAMSGIPIPAGWMPGVEAQAAQREASAARALAQAGGGAGGNAAATAAARGGGAAPGQTPAAAPAAAPAAVALSAEEQANAAATAAGLRSPQAAPAVVAAQEVSIGEQLRKIGIAPLQGATREDVAGLVQVEGKEIDRLIKAAIRAPNTPTNRQQLLDLYARRDTVAGLLSMLVPQAARERPAPGNEPGAFSYLRQPAPPLKSTARIISGQNQGSTQVVDALGRSILQGEQQVP